MKIGLALPHYDFSFPTPRVATVGEVCAYASRAEQAGFDSVWVSDHLFLEIDKYGAPPGRFATPECFTMLAAIAARTTRVRLGSLVVCAPLRSARVMAAQAWSLNEFSDRRLELGVGAGWYEPEFQEVGVSFGSVGERMRTLEHTLVTLRARESCPPLWIGAKGGPRALRIVAEHADGWNVVWRMTPDDYEAILRDRFEPACARARRDPATVRRSVGLYTLLGVDHADLAERFARLQTWTPGVTGTEHLEAFARGGLVGTPHECAARIKEFEALGVEEIILGLGSLPFSVYDDEQIELVAKHLLPLVR